MGNLQQCFRINNTLFIHTCTLISIVLVSKITVSLMTSWTNAGRV